MDSLPPPLDGIRVVDLTSYIAGSYAAMMLADLGAAVVKVESLEGDSFRELPGFFGWNRGKRSIALNLKTPEGREIVERLAREGDVVMENWRPGVADRLGVGHAQLLELNPRLIYCSVTAFGSTGPYVDRPGFDPLLQAHRRADDAAGLRRRRRNISGPRRPTTTRRRSPRRRCWPRCSCASAPDGASASRPRCCAGCWRCSRASRSTIRASPR